MSDGHAETDEETCSNEHAVCEAEGLEDDTKDHDGATDDNGCTSAKEISGVWYDGQGGEGADGHDAV